MGISCCLVITVLGNYLFGHATTSENSCCELASEWVPYNLYKAYNLTYCVITSAAVNGGWGGWSGYSHCNKKCGGGTQLRRRYCNNPYPRYGGARCPRNSQEVRRCNTHRCPGKSKTTVRLGSPCPVVRKWNSTNQRLTLWPTVEFASLWTDLRCHFGFG